MVLPFSKKLLLEGRNISLFETMDEGLIWGWHIPLFTRLSHFYQRKNKI